MELEDKLSDTLNFVLQQTDLQAGQVMNPSVHFTALLKGLQLPSFSTSSQAPPEYFTIPAGEWLEVQRMSPSARARALEAYEIRARAMNPRWRGLFVQELPSDRIVQPGSRHSIEDDLDRQQEIIGYWGMTPIVGNFADAYNAGISFARGNYGEGLFNLSLAVPFYGQCAKGGQIAAKGLKGAGKTADAAKGVKGPLKNLSGKVNDAAAKARFYNPRQIPVNPNNLHHIFGKPGHNLGGFVKSFGGERNAYSILYNATEKAVKGSSGVFERVIRVGGFNITVRGAVINGRLKIGTAFIP